MNGKKGTAKRGLAPLIGNAGEYLVMGELLRRGVIAALAPRNAPDFDILATDHENAVHIRVKTKKAKDWQWNAKTGDWKSEVFKKKGRHDFCALVDLSEEDKPPRFFVVPTRLLERKLQRNHRKWQKGLGIKGQVRSQNNTRRILGECSSLFNGRIEGDWKVLGLKFNL